MSGLENKKTVFSTTPSKNTEFINGVLYEVKYQIVNGEKVPISFTPIKKGE